MLISRAILLAMTLLLILAGCSDEKPTAGPEAPAATAASEAQILYAEGFYDLEQSPSGSWRWMAPAGTVHLKNTGKEMRLRVVGNVPTNQFSQPPKIKIELNGEPLDEFSTFSVDKEYVIPAARQGNKRYSDLRITTDKSFVPKDVDKTSTDARRLAFSLTQLIWFPK
jgi:hypothetical protein